jgi:hypothetical protein
MMASSPAPTTAWMASYSASVPPQVTVISSCGSKSCGVTHLELARDLFAQLDDALHGRVLIAAFGDDLDERLRQGEGSMG